METYLLSQLLVYDTLELLLNSNPPVSFSIIQAGTAPCAHIIGTSVWVRLLGVSNYDPVRPIDMGVITASGTLVFVNDFHGEIRSHNLPYSDFCLYRDGRVYRPEDLGAANLSANAVAGVA
jgi:hypothetical protein